MLGIQILIMFVIKVELVKKLLMWKSWQHDFFVFQLLRVEIFKNMQSLLPWYLLVEEEVIALVEGKEVEDVLNARVVKE